MTRDEVIDAVALRICGHHDDGFEDEESADYWRDEARAVIAPVRPAVLEEAKAACELEYRAAKRDLRDGICPLRADTTLVQVMLRLDVMAKESE